MPQLKRVSFESLLDDKNSFYTGNIIPVKDCYGNIVPYVNPMVSYDIVVDINCGVTEEEILIDIVNDHNLNSYELAKLCKYYKAHNKLKEYRIVNKLLKERKGTRVKQYKKKKNNFNDERKREL